MTKASHTPGPFAIGFDDGSGPEYIIAQGKPIAALRWGCSCCKDAPESFANMTPEEQANAHLFRAAPETLDALDALVAQAVDACGALAEFLAMPCDSLKNKLPTTQKRLESKIAKSRAAIAKAKGEK